MSTRHPDSESSASDLTCRECGKKMRYEMQTEWERVEAEWGFTQRPTGKKTRMWAKPGYLGNGKFCTMRCAYRWAVRNA